MLVYYISNPRRVGRIVKVHPGGDRQFFYVDVLWRGKSKPKTYGVHDLRDFRSMVEYESAKVDEFKRILEEE